MLAVALRGGRFVGAWMRSPLSMGAILPSSRALARAIALQVPLDRPGVVVEIGAGTGAITEALLATGITPERFVIVERDKDLAVFLSTQFPHIRVLCTDAAHIDETLAAEKLQPVCAIVSSLPLLSMPSALRTLVEEKMAIVVGGHGRIIQFTYGLASPISRSVRKKYHLNARRVRSVLGNVPPAHVWVYERKQD